LHAKVPARKIKKAKEGGGEWEKTNLACTVDPTKRATKGGRRDNYSAGRKITWGILIVENVRDGGPRDAATRQSGHSRGGVSGGTETDEAPILE